VPAATVGLSVPGKRIVFSADPAPREGDYDIYVMNAKGGGVSAVTTDDSGSDWPDWQPLR
jgi:Tol biopolymer transport system component